MEEKFEEPFNVEESEEDLSGSGDNLSEELSESTGPGTETSDIDHLLKQYEELPKDEKAKKPLVDKKQKKITKKIPVIPVVAGVLVIGVIIFFISKPKKKNVIKRKVVAQKTVKKTASKTPSLQKAPPSLIYPGAKLLANKKEEDISLKILEVTNPATKIKIFYQKKLSDLGYEIVSVNNGKNFFNMCYIKGKKFCGISIIPFSGKNFVVISKY